MRSPAPVWGARTALLTRQLATLIHAGLPLEEALSAVTAQSEKRRVSHLLAAVRSRVLEGHALATTLAVFPRAFPELFRATVAAGERSGHLGLSWSNWPTTPKFASPVGNQVAQERHRSGQAARLDCHFLLQGASVW